MTASFPEMERLEVIHSLNVEANCGFSVAKEAMYLLYSVFLRVSTHVVQMLFFFFSSEGKGIIWDSTVPCI